VGFNYGDVALRGSLAGNNEPNLTIKNFSNFFCDCFLIWEASMTQLASLVAKWE
jgi:hypothetical protein